MKKLTLERLAIVEPAILTAQLNKARAKTLKTVTQGWYEAMKPYWTAEKLIGETLGCSMSRTHALIDGTKVLSDFYEPTGELKKVTK